MSYQPHYFQEVRKAQQESYSPYSQFRGAYLKTKDGRTFYYQCRKCFLSIIDMC